MITARLSIPRPDGSREEHRLELPSEDAWVGLLDRIEARYGPPFGHPPGSPLDPWVAALLADPPKPENALLPPRGSARQAPNAPTEGRPAPLPLEASAGGVRDTSRDALHRHRASGKLGLQEMVVYGFYRGHPGEGFTRQEVARALGMGINAVTGRVFALINDHKLLRETVRRTCRATGESAMEVRAAENER